MSMKDTRSSLLTGNPWSLMIKLSLPAIIGMVVIGLYSFMDGIFVSKFIGSVAMTAVRVSYPFTLINSGISTLIGVGSASVLSRAVGKNDKDTVNRIMGNLVTCVIILSLIVTALGLIFTKELLVITGAKGECLEYAVRYLRIVFIGSLFVNFAQSANMVMRGEGIIAKAMMIMGTGAVLNIILDPILLSITNSIEGAAYATIISQIVQAIITLVYFIKGSKNVRINAIRIDTKILPQVLSVGVSAMLMQVMQFLQQTIMYRVAENWGGGDWQTILAALLSIQGFAFIPLWGISQGFQPIAGTNYGAKQYDRVKKFTGVFIAGASIIALLFYIPVMFFPETFLTWFIDDNPSAVQTAIPMLRLFFSTYILLGIMIISITLFQSLGKAMYAALITVLRQIVLLIPLIFILPHVANLGAKGIVLAPVITDVAIIILSLIFVAIVFSKMNKESYNLNINK